MLKKTPSLEIIRKASHIINSETENFEALLQKKRGQFSSVFLKVNLKLNLNGQLFFAFF